MWIILSKSIWSIDGTLTGTTIPSQSGPESNCNENRCFVNLDAATLWSCARLSCAC